MLSSGTVGLLLSYFGKLSIAIISPFVTSETITLILIGFSSSKYFCPYSATYFCIVLSIVKYKSFPSFASMTSSTDLLRFSLITLLDPFVPERVSFKKFSMPLCPPFSLACPTTKGAKVPSK